MTEIQSPILFPMLEKLQLWAMLDEADRAAVLSLPTIVRDLRPHEYMIRDGDDAKHVCVLLSGAAIRHKLTGRGARQILSLQVKGDLVDLQNAMLGVADHNVQSISAVRAAYIPIVAIDVVTNAHPAIAKALWRETLVEAAIFREWILNVGRRDARTRMAHLLCEIGLRLAAAGLGTPSAYDLPMTQEHLADALGLTAVHVNRTLKGLQADGLLTYHRKSVRIADWGRLAAAGDFDSAYLRLNRSEPATG